MPSPFPGMDPYLEDPVLWPDVHARLITTIAEALLPALRPQYFVQVEERVYLSDWNDPGLAVFVPDLQIVPTERPSGRGAQTAVIDEPVLMTSAFPIEMRESYLEVQDARTREVITVIEVLSPSNKIPGSASLKSYVDKRDAILQTRTQFVEIDLLRAGQRLPWLKPFSRCDYVAHASTTAGEVRGKAWPMRLQNRLKTVGVPLRPGEPEAPLNLQSVLSTVYDRAGYDLIIDYRSPPESPLTPQQVEWAKGILSAAAPPPK